MKKIPKKVEIPRFRILIVDDNPKNLQVLATTLKQQHYEVEFAIDGNTALEWLNSNDFDLILLDIIMPGMNGFEVCIAIREDLRKDTPIIFLTAETEKESIVKGFSLGAQDYITKPFNTAELLARVKTHLDLKYNKEQLQILNQSLEDQVTKRTRELNLSNQKLMEFDRNKTVFLQILSKELNTPLNEVRGTIQGFKNKSIPEDLKNLVNLLDKNVSKFELLSSLANQITLLKINDGKLQLGSTNTREVIEYLFIEISGKLKKRNIKIELIEKNQNLLFKGEFNLVISCLVNIIDNALDNTSDEGKIAIRIGKEKEMVYFEVIDEGIKCSEEYIKSISDLFSTNKELLNVDLNLGLVLAKQIMDVHMGRVEYHCSENKGRLKLLFHSSQI